MATKYYSYKKIDEQFIVDKNSHSAFILDRNSFYATKSEMSGTVRDPLSKEELTVVKMLIDPSINFDTSMRLLDTLIFHHNNGLTQPPFRSTHDWLEKAGYVYIRSIDGLHQIYLDKNNKQFLLNSNPDVFTVYSEHDYRLLENSEEWKPLEFMDIRKRLIKQIKFLCVHVSLDTTPRKYRRLLWKYIERLYLSLEVERDKIRDNYYNREYAMKHPPMKYTDKLNTSDTFAKTRWSKNIELNTELLKDLVNDKILRANISPDTLARYNLTENNATTSSHSLVPHRNASNHSVESSYVSPYIHEDFNSHPNKYKTRLKTLTRREIIADIDKFLEHNQFILEKKPEIFVPTEKVLAQKKIRY